MKSIFLSVLFLSSLHLSAQTLADFYKKERIGVGLAVSYLNIPDQGFDIKERPYVIRPIVTWDIRYQKPTPKGIYFQYKNIMSSDLLTELIAYQTIDDGTTGYRNITSGFIGRFNIGRNLFYNIEKGRALSAGFAVGDTYLALPFNYFTEGFHITPGIFINYDQLICNNYKLRIFNEVSKSISNFQMWAWEDTHMKFPVFVNSIVEINHIKGFYAAAELYTPFDISTGMSDNQPPHPIRFNLGAGYRFNL